MSPQNSVAPAKKVIGLIAGGGIIPHELACHITRQGHPLVIVALEGQTDPAWIQEFSSVPTLWVALGQVGRVLKFFSAQKVTHVVMVGGIKRPSWDDMVKSLKLDMQGMKMLGKALCQPLGDDALLTLIMNEITRRGYEVLGAHQLMPSLIGESGYLTSSRPSEDHFHDIRHGWTILDLLSPLDIGQSVAIQQGLVLGVEAIEGTDAMITRAGDLKRGGRGPVLVKRPKTNQDTRADLPTIGPVTIRKAAVAGFEGIAFEAGKTLLVDAKNCVALANEAGLFMVGLPESPGYSPDPSSSKQPENPAR